MSWTSRAALSSLLPKEPAANAVSGHYVEELQQLLVGGSKSENWLHARPGMLESVSSNHEPTYLDELQMLRERIVLSSLITTKTVVQGGEEDPTIAVPQNQLPPIAVDGDESSKHKSLIGIEFADLSKITLRGASTSIYTNKQEVADLPKSEEVASVYKNYVSLPIPAYYQATGPFGVPRPNRNTQVFHHNPLYFEETNLERCGQSHGCLTTAVSAAHFATSLAFLPYQAAVTCPDSCVTSLPDCPTCHQFEPGDYLPGCSLKGSAAETAVIIGLIFMIP